MDINKINSPVFNSNASNSLNNSKETNEEIPSGFSLSKDQTQIKTRNKTNIPGNMFSSEIMAKNFSESWNLIFDAELVPKTVESIRGIEGSLIIGDAWLKDENLSKIKVFLELIDRRLDKAEIISDILKKNDLGQQSREVLSSILSFPQKYPNLSTFIKVLDKNEIATPENLTALKDLFKKQDSQTLESMSKILTEYLSKSEVNQENKNLVTDALHDISHPSDIDQKNKGSCVATAIQIKLAIEKPVEYCNLLISMSNSNPYKLPDGGFLRPNDTWKTDPNDKRRYSEKLIQNAFMQAGRENYDSKGTVEGDGGGLNAIQEERVMKRIFGSNEYNLNQGSIFMQGSTFLNAVEDDLAEGKPVVFAFEGHSAIAVGMDKTVNPPQVIIDSYGKQFTMSIEDFKKQLNFVYDYKDNKGQSKIANKTKVFLGDKSEPLF